MIMRQHWLAIILAVIIGSIVGLPHIVIPKIISPQKYDPLQFIDGEGSSITMEEVYTYVPEVREILEGKFWVTDAQVVEYNGRPTPFAGETGLAWVMAALAKLTGSMENAFMAADFLFPAITFLLVYAIVMSFVKDKIVALTSGAVVVLWPELVALFPYPAALTSAFKSAFNPRDFLFISRNFHPQLSLAAYLLALWSLLRSDLATARSDLSRTIMSGLAIGFLFYTYIFNWTAFGLGLILLSMYKIAALVVKRSDPPRSDLRGSDLGKLLIVILVAGLVAIPYFLQVWEFRQTGLATDFFQKLSLPKRGFFDLTVRHWIFVIFYILLVFRPKSNKDSPCSGKENPLRKILFLCFWIALLVLPDLMQNIFGRDLEGKHWVRRIGYPMSIMGLGLLIGEIREIRDIWKKWIDAAAGLVLAGALVYGILVQVNMSRKAAFAYAVDEKKQEFYEFINTKLPAGSVVASLDWETIVNIPAKTHGFNFSPIGMRTIATTDETLDRFLWTAALYDKSEDWVKEEFGDNGIGTTRVYYFMYADRQVLFKTPPDETKKIILRYREIRQRFLAGEKPPFQLMLQSVR